MRGLGLHVLCEFYGCNRKIIDSVSLVKKAMNRAALMAGATVVKSIFHSFEPCGISGVVVIKESHLSIHTWPEKNFCAIDFFTCSRNTEPEKAIKYLKDFFEAENVTTLELQRGIHLTGKRKKDSRDN